MSNHLTSHSQRLKVGSSVPSSTTGLASCGTVTFLPVSRAQQAVNRRGESPLDPAAIRAHSPSGARSGLPFFKRARFVSDVLGPNVALLLDPWVDQAA